MKNTASSALLAALLVSAAAAHAQMYRWVDSNGRVQYSDRPPTTYNQTGGAEMNSQGQVIRRTQSEAERRAEATRQAEHKRIQEERRKQAQLDRALMSTYTSEAEIDLARDRALEHHRLAIKGAETRAEVVDANVSELRARIAAVAQSGRPVSANLRDRLARATKEKEDLKRTIQGHEEAMEKVRDKYADDKARFRVLSGKK